MAIVKIEATNIDYYDFTGIPPLGDKRYVSSYTKAELWADVWWTNSADGGRIVARHYNAEGFHCRVDGVYDTNSNVRAWRRANIKSMLEHATNELLTLENKVLNVVVTVSSGGTNADKIYTDKGPPYIEIDYVAVPITIVDPSLSNVTLSKDKPITLSWVHGGSPQFEYEIKYTHNGDEKIKKVQSDAQSHTFAVGELPEGKITYQIRLCNSFIKSDWTQVRTFTTIANKITSFTPSGNQSQEDAITVKWDSSDEQMQYEFEYTSRLGTKSIKGTTLKSHTFPANSFYLETVTMRVRTYNGYVWSAWKSANFEATGTKYPNNLEPSGIAQNKDKPITLSWVAKFQTSYELQYTSNGLTTTKTGTTGKSIIIPADTLATGRIDWKIKINTGLLVTDWVTASFITFGKPETPKLMTLAEYQTATPILTWESVGQVSYRLQILEAGIVILDSGDVYSSAKKHTFDTFLKNNATYTAKLSISNQYEYASDWATKNFKIVFEELQEPTFSMFNDDKLGRILFNIYNAEGQINFQHCELYRREYGEEKWLRVATNLPLIAPYIDYTCRSGVLYEYKARAISKQGGNTDSEIGLKEVKLRNTMLSDTDDLDNYVVLIHNPKKSRGFVKETHAMQYSGASSPTFEFGEVRYVSVNISFTVDEKTLDKLLDLYYNNNVLLFRDNRGKKIYGHISDEPVADDAEFMKYTVSFNFIETNYNEGVLV